jgi:hypothetical protein
MSTIFSNTIHRRELAYDYSSIWPRRAGGIDWKAVVRNATWFVGRAVRKGRCCVENEVLASIRQRSTDRLALAVGCRYRAGLLKL